MANPPLIIPCLYYTGTVRVLQPKTHPCEKRRDGSLRLFPFHFGPHRQPQQQVDFKTSVGGRNTPIQWAPSSFSFLLISIMRTTLNNLNNIVFYAVDDTVCLVNSTAPIRRKVAAQSFRLADAFVSIAVDVPEQLKNSPESLSILSHPVLEILPCRICPRFNHPNSPHGQCRQWTPFARWIF